MSKEAEIRVVVFYDGEWYNKQTGEAVKNALITGLRHDLARDDLPVEVEFHPRSGGGSYKVDVRVDTEPFGIVLMNERLLARHLSGQISSGLSRTLTDELVGLGDIRVQIVGIMAVSESGVNWP